ncbi:MAG: hypothetical protein NPIRA02_26240 [Nitrospirales bacterium]|nr:MAG: hypothetical protein NPIRA02_26240 [Nitrospirales bacterium]
MTDTGGPLTLAQARVMVRAQAKSPKQTPRRQALGKATVDLATPGTVGAERKKLQLKTRRENQRRIREYTATLKLLKRHGVKGLTPNRTRRRRTGEETSIARAGQPLQILAEGDSWFDYPVPFFGGGIIKRLEDLVGVPILNFAKAGDEVRFMMGVEERTLLAEQLTKGCPAGGPWEVLLFSGGGNDVVDNPMVLWVKNFDSALPAAGHIHQARFEAVLELVRAGYEDLIAMRDRLSSTTHLVFHAYDFAIPDGRGVCHLGPWLKPTFDLRGFPTRPIAFEVVKVMLQQFAALLQSLVRPDVTFINTQGTLTPSPSSWHNELHPTKDGFKKFAKIFHQQLKVKFPGRVL